MESQPGTGVPAASPPAALDYSAFARDADARDLGKTPAAPTPAPDPAVSADSASAPPAEQAASTDATPAPASEPGNPDGKKPRNLQSRREGVEAEIAELRAKIDLRKALRAELETLGRAPNATQPGSQPAAPTVQDWQRYRAHKDAPKETQFAEYEDFVAAMSVFAARQFHTEQAQRDRLDAESRERSKGLEGQIKGFNERIEQARTADPAFDEKVNAELLKVPPAFTLKPGQVVHPANAIMSAIVESDVPAELLIFFSTPEGQEEWTRLISLQTPSRLMRAIGRIESRFLASGQPAASAAAKTVTSAPNPPTVLGNEPPAAPDRARQHLAAGDFTAWKRAQDDLDLARAR